MSVLQRGYRMIPAVPTVYRGVRMRSRLEARSAHALDELGIPWVYEPRTFGRYLPDFQLWPGAPRPWFLEIKPPSVLGDVVGTDLRATLAKMNRIRVTHPDAGLMLWISKPRNRDLGAILVDLPGVVGWTARPARAVLLTSLRVERGSKRRRSWWRWR
jgi:hypothetical protein